MIEEQHLWLVKLLQQVVELLRRVRGVLSGLLLGDGLVARVLRVRLNASSHANFGFHFGNMLLQLLIRLQR
jgi:hypothetical protein